jgi:hypothetical protein
MRYALLLVIFLGCARRDLAPVAAVYGTYGLLDYKQNIVVKECPPSCKCNGTGKVRTGDGLAIVDCGCPSTCKCKEGKNDAR